MHVMWQQWWEEKCIKVFCFKQDYSLSMSHILRPTFNLNHFFFFFFLLPVFKLHILYTYSSNYFNHDFLSQLILLYKITFLWGNNLILIPTCFSTALSFWSSALSPNPGEKMYTYVILKCIILGYLSIFCWVLLYLKIYFNTTLLYWGKIVLKWNNFLCT